MANLNADGLYAPRYASSDWPFAAVLPSNTDSSSGKRKVFLWPSLRLNEGRGTSCTSYPDDQPSLSLSAGYIYTPLKTDILSR
jgi:hypothetical protein